MNVMRCQYEREVIRAQQTGEYSERLMEHKRNCGDCREAAELARVLRRDANELAAQCALPSPERVWAAAERHRQMNRLAQAARLVHVLKIAGMVYALMVFLWGLHMLFARGIAAPWLDGKSLNAVIEGAGLAVLFVSSGLWYVLRGDRQRAN